MKKLLTILSIISLIFLASCGKKVEENSNLDEENKIENELNIDSDLDNQEINIDDIYEF
jgi:thioredoxin-related protein